MLNICCNNGHCVACIIINSFYKCKPMKTIMSLVVFSLLTLNIHAQTDWKVDKAHSSIGFSVTHMGISKSVGTFTDFEGTVSSESKENFDGAKVSFTAQAASINTHNERRDGHLKSPDFFDVETFPTIHFSGTIVTEGDKHYLVGDFTMKDKTNPIKFKVTYGGMVEGRRGPVAGFQIIGSINRYDYNINFDRAMPGGGLVVSNDVTILCNVELNGPSEEGRG